MTPRRAFALGCAAGVVITGLWLAGLALMDAGAVRAGQAIR